MEEEEEVEVTPPPPAAAAAAAAAEEEEEEEEKEEVLVAGVDFGTQKCVVSLMTSSMSFPVVVINDLSNRSTPAATFFRDGLRYAGEQASYGQSRNPAAAPHSLR